MKFWTQALLAGGAVVIGIWAGLPWITLVAMGLLAAETSSVARRQALSQWSLRLTWACTLPGLGAIVFGRSGFRHAGVGLSALLLGAAMSLAARAVPAEARTRWRLAGVTWLLSGGVLWLAYAYGENRFGAFHAGLLLNVILLLRVKAWFRLPGGLIQTANTLLLLLIALPIVDACLRPRYRKDPDPDPAKRYYSYEVAMKNPGGYEAWHRRLGHELRMAMLRTYSGSNAAPLPFRAVPNADATIFQSRVHINSLGYRGREIPREKGNAYRIVALGESTTWGITLTAGDEPWPDQLEAMIRDRLKPDRPVEVINTGVPGFTLKDNLYRLRTEILSLKPDMIISYHGLNGFPFILSALPELAVTNPPVYRERPLKLLADCEFKLDILRFRRQQGARLKLEPPALPDPLETEFAALYQQLIELTRTNGIRLVLANYSMAVNERSDPRVIDFYRQIFVAAPWYIKANELHTRMVDELVARNPEVLFVNTHPGLDGCHALFADMVHFAPEGRRHLAETFFSGLRDCLENELRRPAAAGRE